MDRLPRWLALAALLLAGPGCHPAGAHKSATKPSPPPRVLLLRAESLRAAPVESSPELVKLAQGETLEVVKLGDDWSKVRTLAGREGWVHREGFARRTLVTGAITEWELRTAVDHLRKVPELDVVRVDTTGFSPGSTVEAARQASRGFDVHWVIIINASATGSGQLLYEVVDVESGAAVASGATDRTPYPVQVMEGLTADIYSIVHQEPAAPSPATSPVPSPSPGSRPVGSASGTPPPTPTPTVVPELPHPNAPLPEASPTPAQTRPVTP